MSTSPRSSAPRDARRSDAPSRRRPRPSSSRASGSATCSRRADRPGDDARGLPRARSALVRMIDPAAMGRFRVDGLRPRLAGRSRRPPGLRLPLGPRQPRRTAGEAANGSTRANALLLRSADGRLSLVVVVHRTAGERIANLHARSARSAPRPVRPPPGHSAGVAARSRKAPPSDRLAADLGTVGEPARPCPARPSPARMTVRGGARAAVVRLSTGSAIRRRRIGSRLARREFA